MNCIVCDSPIKRERDSVLCLLSGHRVHKRCIDRTVEGILNALERERFHRRDLYRENYDSIFKK